MTTRNWTTSRVINKRNCDCMKASRPNHILEKWKTKRSNHLDTGTQHYPVRNPHHAGGDPVGCGRSINMQSPSVEIRLPSDRGGVPLHMRRTRSRQDIFFFFFLGFGSMFCKDNDILRT
ncbi:hypothetical protein BDV36DRAFT_11807 [Aspergillus pseudocaelatus]|uniref:Uncharacterized protein n=1 Tax=Aspergillus pseudocaelatus TaxID=1825620 RepID=A0ABQ6WAW7_9EURO|nr:hypothetical protein BDV36DRAFT_11807 [Aspergillus pseudocaelatus]